MKGFVGTLLSKWDRLNDEQKKLMLTTVHSDSERLSRLITELLDVARIDTGRLPLYPRAVDTADARGAVRGVGPGGDHPHASSRRTPTPVPQIFADPDKLTQVVTNVVDNAIRHGEGTVRVTVEPITEPFPGVLIRVDDDGRGDPRGDPRPGCSPSSGSTASAAAPAWACTSSTASSASTAARC